MAKTVSTISGSKQKQQKMGHAKVSQQAHIVPCSQDHPTQLVHYNHLHNMRRWCPTCQEVL